MDYQAVEVYFGHDQDGHRVVNYSDAEGLIDWQKKMITIDELERIKKATYDKIDSLLSEYV